MRGKSSKSVAVIADSHIGNLWALCSPDWFHIFKGDDRKFHEKLYYDGWLEACRDKLSNKFPLLHALNGDIIDGANRKTMGAEVWSTNIDDQIQDAKKLLKHHRISNIICTTGSGYHQREGATSYEQILARELNAICRDGRFADKIVNWQRKKNPIEREIGEEPTTTGSTKYAEYSWWVAIFGRIISFTHHVPYAKWAAYRTTALAREMAALELDSKKTNPMGLSPSFVIRSHAHYSVKVEFGTTWGMITPAWKFPDEHLHRGGEGGNTPNVGIAEIIIEPNGKRELIKHELSGVEFPKRKVLNLTPEYKGKWYG